MGICARALMRRRVFGALAVALLIGIAGGAVLAAFTDRAPCRAKTRRPPSAVALAVADRLRGADPSPGQHVVVDLAQYAAATAGVRKAAAEGSS